MIRGVVNARREAVVTLRIRGPGGAETDVETVIDTGFSSSLTLPAATIAALGLTRAADGTAALADGSIQQFEIYTAEAEWDGVWRPLLAWAVGDEALIGMQMLAGYELRVAVAPGGGVEITPLPE